MNIHVVIQRVILDGVSVSAHDVPDLQTAIEVELAEQLLAQGIEPVLTAGGAFLHLTGGPVSASRGITASELGSDIGRAAFDALGNAEAQRRAT